MNSCGIHGNFLWKGCAKVIIEHQGQALTVAMEMERRAIRTYERALLLAKDEEVRKGIEDILGDERRHLKRFTEMWDKTVNSAEQQVLLQAMAADVLFRGGVTEMAREDALTTLTGLYRYAMESEAVNRDKHAEAGDFRASQCITMLLGFPVAASISSNFAALSQRSQRRKLGVQRSPKHKRSPLTKQNPSRGFWLSSWCAGIVDNFFANQRIFRHSM